MTYKATVNSVNGTIKTMDTIQALLETNNDLNTDKEVMETCLLDLYTVDGGAKYYITTGYAKQLTNNQYQIIVSH